MYTNVCTTVVRRRGASVHLRAAAARDVARMFLRENRAQSGRIICAGLTLPANTTSYLFAPVRATMALISPPVSSSPCPPYVVRGKNTTNASSGRTRPRGSSVQQLPTAADDIQRIIHRSTCSRCTAAGGQSLSHSFLFFLSLSHLVKVIANLETENSSQRFCLATRTTVHRRVASRARFFGSSRKSDELEHPV